jgi:NADH-quinone oxidoreductase subunit J
MTPELIIFLGLGLVAVAAALGMLFSRSAIYSALFLIVNFMTVAVFYLQLSAPFIALAQVTVYAGAIMVLFLFVIMLLGAEQGGQRASTRWWYQPLALFLGLVLLVESAYIVLNQRGSLPALQPPQAGFGSPVTVGELLFSQYLLPFEITSILLLVAMVGAIVLSLREKRGEKVERTLAEQQTRPVGGVLRREDVSTPDEKPSLETPDTVAERR